MIFVISKFVVFTSQFLGDGAVTIMFLLVLPLLVRNDQTVSQRKHLVYFCFIILSTKFVNLWLLQWHGSSEQSKDITGQKKFILLISLNFLDQVKTYFAISHIITVISKCYSMMKIAKWSLWQEQREVIFPKWLIVMQLLHYLENWTILYDLDVKLIA